LIRYNFCGFHEFHHCILVAKDLGAESARLAGLDFEGKILIILRKRN
jgi:uncharacterized Rossmann fold enzyme